MTTIRLRKTLLLLTTQRRLEAKVLRSVSFSIVSEPLSFPLPLRFFIPSAQ